MAPFTLEDSYDTQNVSTMYMPELLGDCHQQCQFSSHIFLFGWVGLGQI